MQNKSEIRGLAYLQDILEHLLSKSKVRGWLICEIGLYGVYTVTIAQNYRLRVQQSEFLLLEGIEGS